jgi:hypothetical protein
MKCVKCGTVAYLGIIILIIAVFSLGCGNNSTDTTASTTTQQTKQSADNSKPKVKTYKAGQYKVGQDIPAGEYVAIAKGEAYIEVAKNSKGTLESILVNDIFINRSMITVSDGQYLKTQDCTLYASKDAPKVELKNGYLLSGMYKVGVDVPAGEYKVISDGDGSYIEVSKSSRHTLDDIVSNDLFQGNKYITISNGQYVKFFDSKIKVK